MSSDAKLRAARQAEPLFAARLTPHNALSRKGLRIVIGLLVVLAAIPSLVFLSLGAWPIIGFMGLDIIAICAALLWSRRSGRQFEEVALWSDSLEIRQVDARGRETKSRFHPSQVRLVIERDYEERTTGLRLRGDDVSLEIGSFLNPEDKSSFAKAFGTALRKARNQAAL